MAAARHLLRVLVVDDAINIRRVLQIQLKELGCSVEEASSVEEALVRIAASDFDLVLTDYKMAEQTGLDLLRQVRLTHPRLKVVVMTAYATFDHAVTMVKEGAYDYLAKPFSTEQLRKMLAKVREGDTALRESSSPDSDEDSDLHTIEEMEKELIAKVLANEPNQEKAAAILGITKVTLWRKRKLYGLQ